MYHLITVKKKNQSFFVFDFNDTHKKGMNMENKVFPQRHERCQKPEKVSKPILENLFTTYQG